MAAIHRSSAGHWQHHFAIVQCPVKTILFTAPKNPNSARPAGCTLRSTESKSSNWNGYENCTAAGLAIRLNNQPRSRSRHGRRRGAEVLQSQSGMEW